jgi:hypothetical protein
MAGYNNKPKVTGGYSPIGCKRSFEGEDHDHPGKGCFSRTGMRSRRRTMLAESLEGASPLAPWKTKLALFGLDQLMCIGRGPSLWRFVWRLRGRGCLAISISAVQSPKASSLALSPRACPERAPRTTPLKMRTCLEQLWALCPEGAKGLSPLAPSGHSSHSLPRS